MSCRSDRAAVVPKSPLLDPRLLCGECYSSGPHGMMRPQKEIKDRSVFENKYKEGRWLRVTLPVISGGGGTYLM